LRGNGTVQTDIELIEGCKRGDMTAFKQLYERHKLKMYTIALKMHGNREDAEDSIQEAFVLLYKKLNTFRGKSAFSTWFYRIVVNTCLNKLRKKKEKLKLDLHDSSPEIPQEDGRNGDVSLKALLDTEIKNLSPGYRAVFVLYEVEGFTHREIAEILKINEGTSKSQLHAAKLYLRKRLEPYRESLKNEL